MAHVYEVATNQGNFDVNTPHHHGDHDDKTFAQHLLDVIKQSGAQIVAGLVVHRFTYKGRR